MTITLSQELTELIERAAASHPTLADPKQLVAFVLDDMQGRETEFLRHLLPRTIAAQLRQRRKPVSTTDAWQGFLAERMPSPQGYIFVRDATPTDLDQAADRRRRFAGNLDNRAAQYTSIATALRDQHLKVAGQLDGETGGQLLVELEFRLQTERRLRLTAQHRAQELHNLRLLRDQLLDQINRKESAALTYYRQRRDELNQLLKQSLEDREGAKETKGIVEGWLYG